jgi:hypothetical protein
MQPIDDEQLHFYLKYQSLIEASCSKELSATFWSTLASDRGSFFVIGTGTQTAGTGLKWRVAVIGHGAVGVWIEDDMVAELELSQLYAARFHELHLLAGEWRSSSQRPACEHQTAEHTLMNAMRSAWDRNMGRPRNDSARDCPGLASW